MVDVEEFAPAKGSCSCGSLRFELDRKPMFVNCCHCNQCQKLTGSAFVLNGIIENEAITVLSGEIEISRGPVTGDGVHDVHRCANCKTAVWSDYARRPNYRYVRLGTLEEPQRFKPDAHIFTATKLDWVKIPEDQSSYDEEYDIEEDWSPEAQSRRRAALGLRELG